MTRWLLPLLCLALVGQAVAQGRVKGDRQPGRQGLDRRQMHPLFRRLFQMGLTVKLSGTRVVQHLEGGQRRLVTERVLRDGPRIRTEVLGDGGVLLEIAVEDRGSRRIWSQRTNEIREFPPREGEALNRLAHMVGRVKNAGQLEETAGGQVAGVPTRLLELKAKQRVLARAWIDPAHGVLLKMQTFDPKGQLNGSMEFTSVRFNPTIAPGSFDINRPGARLVTATEDLRRACRELGFRPYRLPAEWQLVLVRKMEPRGTKVLMQVYRSATGRVSLFQIQGEVNAERLSRMVGGEANSHVWDREGYKFALIGPMSSEDLRRLADRVAP